MNLQLAQEILASLQSQGVSEYLICAGARNAPFVHLLGLEFENKNFNSDSFFDERAAGFFALGRSKRDQKPVAVVTTSGTAVAELLPAAIEAHYSQAPLVLITADRPRSYRGRAAPQSIEQVGIFSHYASRTYDIENLSDVKDLVLDPRGVTHINVCFSEPLLNEEGFSYKIFTNLFSQQKTAGAYFCLPDLDLRNQQNLEAHRAQITQFFDKSKRPLVILGTIPVEKRNAICEYLVRQGAPIYAEAPSGLREHPQLQKLILKSGELLLSTQKFQEHFDSVLRVGSVPTLRLWRDLESGLAHIPVLSICDLHFSGLARSSDAALSFDIFLENIFSVQQESVPVEGMSKVAINTSAILEQDAQQTKLLNANIESETSSEPAVMRWISEKIPSHSFVFLGNSLPIREWDLAARYDYKNIEVAANRGANGIDGLISTFLGMCSEKNENWLILGDLSALYDLNALAFARLREHKRVCIVVINNGGGQIFNRMFKDKNFLNTHDFDFSQWAKMFRFEYKRVSMASEWPDALTKPTVIEVVPNNLETQKFWSRMSTEVST